MPRLRARAWLAPGLFLLLTACFFGRALVGPGVLLPLDVLFLYPPWREHAAAFGVSVPHNHLIADTILQNVSWKALAARGYAAGQAPLWNPEILAGQPFLAAGQNASLYPPGLLFYVLPDGVAYGWFAALHLALGAGLTYWLARVLGASRFGGLIAGVTFGWCGYLVVSVLWPMVVSTAVWLPGLLAVVELVIRRVVSGPGSAAWTEGGQVSAEQGQAGSVGRTPGVATEAPARPGRRVVAVVPLWLTGALMVTLQFLAGHLEMSLYLLLTAGLFTVLRLGALWLGGWGRPAVGPGGAGSGRGRGGDRVWSGLVRRVSWDAAREAPPAVRPDVMARREAEPAGSPGEVVARSSAVPPRHREPSVEPGPGRAGGDLGTATATDPADLTPGGLAAWDGRGVRLGRLVLIGLGLLGMVLLGSLGAAVQLTPFAEAIAANVRVGQVSYDDVRAYALPRQQAIAFLAPDFFGNPTHHAVFDLFEGRRRPVDLPLAESGAEPRWGTEWGPKNYVEGTVYTGLLPLLLALAALLFRSDAVTRILVLMALVCLLFAFGTPLYALLFFGLPGVDQLHTPFRWLYPFSLCLALLAGLGATALERRPTGCRRAAAIGAGGLLLGLIVLVLLMVGWVQQQQVIGVLERLMRRSSGLIESFPDAQALFSYQWIGLLGLALLLVSSGLVVLGLARRAPAARALALVLLVGDLFSFGIGFNTVADPAPLRFVPPPVQTVLDQAGMHRIATFGPDDTLPANTGMLFGLQDIRGYDTIILRDYVRFLELIEPQTGLLYSKVNKLFQAASLESPLLDFLNVGYLFTTQRLESPKWTLLHDGQVRVYRNERALPRAGLVERALPAADRSTALRLLDQPGFDPRSSVVVEVDPAPLVESTVRTPGSGFEGPLGPEPRIVEYGLNRVRIEATLLRPGYLVLSDVDFSGWQARVDGSEHPLLRANAAFRAVQLTAGQHEVVFEYRPLSFRVGLLLSGLALGLATLLAAVWGYLRLGIASRTSGGAVARVARNSIFPLATGLVNRALDFGFALVYLRLLGPQGTGQYTFAVVIVGYFDILVNFGLGTLLTREVARDAAASDRFFVGALLARLWLASLVLVAALVLAGPLAEPLQISSEVGLAIVILTLGMLPGALASTSSALFMAHERMEVPAAVTVLSTLARIGLGTLVLLAGWGIVGLAVVSLGVNLLNAVVLGILQLVLFGLPRPRVNAAFSLGLLALSWPLMLNNFLNSLFFRIDAVLLKPLAGDVALGHYSTAYKLIDGLQIIPSTFVLALFPLLARQASGPRDGLRQAFMVALKILLALALPISVGTMLLAEPIILVLGGPAYLPDSALALRVLIWYLPFSFVNGLTQYLLIALNRQRWITVCFFAGAIVNVLLNLWLIPRYGYLGAAAVTVLSEVVLLAPFWYAVRLDLRSVPLLALTWRPVLAAAVMGLALTWLGPAPLPLAVLIGAFVYLLTMISLRAFSAEEVAALRRRG